MAYGKGGVYAPNYYSRFKCIADGCKHSCCIGWEICIDGITLEKYKPIQNIYSTVTECDGGHCFALRADGRCPHLCDSGLCSIIISHGEDFLSDICKAHPRFYNYVGHGRTEVGLGISCEAACRLILENDRPFSLIKIDSCQGESDSCGADRPFDALSVRDEIISASETDTCFDSVVSSLKDAFKIPSLYTELEWINRYLELEILDTGWAKLLSSAASIPPERKSHQGEFDIYYKRLLTYFVYRHVSTAESIDGLRARLAFAILSAEMIRLLFEAGTEQSFAGLLETARLYSSEIEYSEDNTAELIFEFESSV